MNMRAILLSVNETADYSLPALQEQANEINKDELRKIIDALATRAAIFVHAFEMMDEGVLSHPMQAFLHASECITNPDGSRITDSEFYALLVLWKRTCDTAVNRDKAAPAQSDFVSQFMRSE
jgi:hypothetical protein